jgi:hypothetical protein
MVKHAIQTERTPRRRRRGVVVTVITVALMLPFASTFAAYWGNTEDDLSVVRSERQGVEYLRPLLKLAGELAEAQTAAVRGDRPNAAAVQSAVAAVAAVDQVHGASLDVTERWTGLRKRISDLQARTVTGREALASYSEVTGLTQALLNKVGDTSQLILDPELDSYYLMDTALLRLPLLLVDSGRMVDLTRLAAVRLDQPEAVRVGPIFAARDRLASTSASIDVGLRKSFDATSSSTLGPSLLGQVDRLRSAVSELAPADVLIDSPVSLSNPDGLAADRERLAETALQLGDASLAALDGLLDARETGIQQARTGVLAGLALTVIAGGLLLRSRLPRREEADSRPDETELARQRRSAEEAELRMADLHELIDARELLASGELSRIGRAVQPKREKSSDAE